MPRTAMIIGCGVSGPATAMFLSRLGWQVSIHEAGRGPDDYAGAFLNVATNGLAVLEVLGLRDRLLTDAHHCPTLVMRSGRGKTLGTVPNGPAGDASRGSAVMRRAWLHQVLREEAQRRGAAITFGAQLTGIMQLDGGVRASFADGAVAEADILIGADGIGSPTRRHIDPDAPEPAYAGLVGVGGYARTDALGPTPGAQYFVFGRRSFYGYLAREDGEVFWFANVTRRESTREEIRAVTTEAWLAELHALHAHDPSPVAEILANTTGPVGGYPVYDLAHVPDWSRGRVVGVGDAVHATTPSVGQGASLALEDTIELARCLRDIAEPADAFAAYQLLRQPRAEKVVAYGQEISKRKIISRNPLAVLARDALLPIFLRKAATDTTVNWLYDHRTQWDQPVSACARPSPSTQCASLRPSHDPSTTIPGSTP